MMTTAAPTAATTRSNDAGRYMKRARSIATGGVERAGVNTDSYIVT